MTYRDLIHSGKTILGLKRNKNGRLIQAWVIADEGVKVIRLKKDL